jgi:cyclic dehypoxanthinyl futalosine synthase
LISPLDKVKNKERFTFKEGVELFSVDFLKLAIAADIFRREKHGHDYVGFVLDRNITFTNICSARCDFCAFWRNEKDEDAFLLSIDEILEKVEYLKKLGGTQVMLQGGLNGKCDLTFYKHMLGAIKSTYPDITLHSLSPAEVFYLSKKHRLSVKEVLLELKSAGLSSLPGAAEILVDRVRNIVSPGKLKTEDWLSVMRSCAEIGMNSTATMTFGMVETEEERIEHLQKIRDLQDETGVFRAFIPWTFSPDNTKIGHIKKAGTEDYLRMVAISRLFLDNIDHIHAGWVTEGLGVASIALSMGADDMGGILMEEVVVKATGISHRVEKEDLIKHIKNAGKIPVRRNTAYEILEVIGA